MRVRFGGEWIADCPDVVLLHEVGRVDDLVSFEPDKVEVSLDLERLHLEPGQQVMSHGSTAPWGTDEVLFH
ncbi:hypothetical protein [Streptomyces mirabilis]|uniref:hypothetical protein n=1 Tax=Streptomyces mirabilis TaxID=68239 RepID=UPI0036AD0EA8